MDFLLSDPCTLDVTPQIFEDRDPVVNAHASHVWASVSGTAIKNTYVAWFFLIVIYCYLIILLYLDGFGKLACAFVLARKLLLGECRSVCMAGPNGCIGVENWLKIGMLCKAFIPESIFKIFYFFYFFIFFFLYFIFFIYCKD